MISKHFAKSLTLFGLGLSAVGAAQPDCASCHRDVVESFARTGMGQSVGAPQLAKARFEHPLSNSSLSVDGAKHQVRRTNLTAEYPVTLRIGSGKVGSSFATSTNGRWYQSPISWFAQTRQFRISPGFEQDRHPDFDREVKEECLYCHSGGTAAQPRAIGCERCHGSVSSHDQLVNPARLTGAVRDSICEQCHLQGAARILNPGRRMTDYKPGEVLENTWTTYITEDSFKVTSHSEQFAQSPCARSGKLWCSTCHNPHPTAAKPQRSTDAVCQDCHQPHRGGEARCAGCHMPKRPVADVVHTSYTDHRIQKPGSPLAVSKEALRAWRPAAMGLAQRNEGLALFQWGQRTKQSWAILRSFNVLVDLPTVKDAEVAAALGVVAMQKGRPKEALKWLEVAPKDASTWIQIGTAFLMDGQNEAAKQSFQRAVDADPDLFQGYVALADLQKRSGDRAGYLRTLNAYLKRFPQNLSVRLAVLRE